MRAVLRLLVLGVLLTGSSGFAAAPADLVGTFSEGRARAEGRAKLVQGCSIGSRGVPATLLTGYDDARASVNARIDRVIAHLKSNTFKDLDSQVELGRLNESLNKVDDFVRKADHFLTERRCSFYRKAGIGWVAQLALQPEVWKLIWEAYQKLSGSEAERAELIKQFDAQRISEWGSVRLTVVYDADKAEFVPADRLTWPVLQNTTTKVYINEWGLPAANDSLKPFAQRPEGLSPSYKLFSGDLDQLFKSPSRSPP